ncbi:MAG TPA: serine hydrolase domain-containing protein [Puia sp.]|uniref:serine hydrolase domain-containing protein n=1 Tax=Puia sp. TaxID=2045100 RepID=UPI002CA09185|nr:serine hydrolase domain-containing protein [Puia sp.]HVU95984.1 serine hydrolase domain-containing protein [Puia sp.]
MRNLILLLALGWLGTCRAQEGFEKVDAWMEDNVRAMGGHALLVVEKDGKIVYTKGVHGLRGPFTLQSRERIASSSKWLSAALVMTFVDEGKLSLDDTVGRWLPVLARHGKGGITVRQCLSHLTGIKEPPMGRSLGELRRMRSMDEAMEWIAEMPMEGEPGTVFHYSNAGLQIAGAVLEKIGGASFETLFAERIARPLGMTNTDFGRGAVAMPAGGGYSTAEDYIRFLEMILNKGVYRGVRVLSEESVAEMQVNRLGADVRIAYTPAEHGGAGVGYGYGEWIMGEAVSSPGLFGSFPWVVNGRGYCAFLMTVNWNNRGRQDREMELVRLVDAAL